MALRKLTDCRRRTFQWQNTTASCLLFSHFCILTFRIRKKANEKADTKIKLSKEFSFWCTFIFVNVVIRWVMAWSVALWKNIASPFIVGSCFIFHFTAVTDSLFISLHVSLVVIYLIFNLKHKFILLWACKKKPCVIVKWLKFSVYFMSRMKFEYNANFSSFFFN